MKDTDRAIYVVGHKNPDTDSICSAIAYAELKNRTTKLRHIPVRTGHVNEETQYVLNRFNIKRPKFMESVNTQVKDINYRETEGVDNSISLKKAWTLMQEKDVVTLPITDNRRLEGLITISDIATSYMAVYDNSIIGRARTPYSNILETIEGTLIYGNEHSYVVKGKVLIAAANPDLMEDYIEPDDIVILGNRYESQLCAIEMHASCIIVCEGANVSLTIRKLAEDNACTVISTPHDTFTVARLINQSMPIKYFMRKDHLLTFNMDDAVDSIKEVMTKKRHRDFPILDSKGEYIGMVSRRNLLEMRKKQVILVDHNEKTQAIDGIDDAEILEIIDHHRLGSLETLAPVYFRNQPVGCTATIVFQMFNEQGVGIPEDIAGILCAAILSDTLMFRSPTCTPIDVEAANRLATIANIDVETFSKEMFSAASNLTSKKPKTVFYQDFKNFAVGDISIGIGQVNSLDQDELELIKDRMKDFISSEFSNNSADMVFFMLTNIIEESTTLLCYGDNAEDVVREAFKVNVENHTCVLKGVVSRKKQLIPTLVGEIQQ